MRIKIFSDLHIGINGDYDISLFKTDADVIIFPGDLCESQKIIDELRFIDGMTNSHVIFVPGNHEYYGSTKEYIDSVFEKEKFKNITILNNDTIEIGSVVFIGSTGWWDFNIRTNHIRYMNDFNSIFDILQNAYGTKWGSNCRDFMTRTLNNIPVDKKIVCATHNVPSHKLIPNQYKDDPYNDLFANRWDDILNDFDIKLWVCGHTHSYFDEIISGTRCVCNPYGYKIYREHVDFVKNKIVKI